MEGNLSPFDTSFQLNEMLMSASASHPNSAPFIGEESMSPG